MENVEDAKVGLLVKANRDTYFVEKGTIGKIISLKDTPELRVDEVVVEWIKPLDKIDGYECENEYYSCKYGEHVFIEDLDLFE